MSKERKRVEQARLEKREEALMYLGEVISANRSLKEWMLQNAFYALTAVGAIFGLFKDESRQSFFWGFVVPAFLMFFVCRAARIILRANHDSINKLKDKERKLISETPLAWVDANWAGGSKVDERKEQEQFYLNLYRNSVEGAAIVLLCFLLSQTTLARYLVDAVCHWMIAFQPCC